MFINFSNHPSVLWEENQLNSAKKFGEIIDIPFPNIPADLDEEGIELLCQKYLKIIIDLNPDAVMCQGEYTLCFKIVLGLLDSNIIALSACSDRNTVLLDNNKKKIIFKFKKFRKFERN